MLWGVEVESPRVLAIREQRNEAQRLGIGEGRDEEAQKFAQGKGVVRISHNALFTHANANLDSFKWPKVLVFEGGKCWLR